MEHYTDKDILESWSQSTPKITDETSMIARFRSFLSSLRDRSKFSNTGLNNCPFCGAEDGKTFDPSEGTSPLAEMPCLRVNQEYLPFNTMRPYFFVKCNVCGATGPFKSTFDEAVELWNSRPAI